MKTYEGWQQSDARTFEDYVNPGDEVDAEIYDHFLEVLPPAEQGIGYFLVGEPADTDAEGFLVFDKFTSVDNKVFRYVGLRRLKKQ